MSLENEMKFSIGDWSDDGHGKTQEFRFSTDSSIDDVRQAYLKSCELTKISFDTNKGRNTNIKHAICCDYEDRVISMDALKVLIGHGLVCLSESDYADGTPFPEKCFFESSYDKNGQYVNVDDFCKLLIWFIKLSLPEFKIEETKDVPSVNGYWDKDLNEMWGYGLFY